MCISSANSDQQQMDTCLKNRGSMIDGSRIGRHQTGTSSRGYSTVLRICLSGRRGNNRYATQGHISASKLSSLQIIGHTLRSLCACFPVQTLEPMVFSSDVQGERELNNHRLRGAEQQGITGRDPCFLVRTHHS